MNTTFQKTPGEKLLLKKYKKEAKNSDISLIGAFLKNSMPNWGSFIFNGNRL